jgi:hypothetical protein
LYDKEVPEVETNTVVIIVLAIVVLAHVAWIVLQSRRSKHLQKRFGPEYDRAISEHGDKRKAEALLEKREKRIENLEIRPLSRQDRDRFAEAWRADQARFVDDPKSAVIEADRLVAEVMRVRGYPVGDFEQRAADVSVNYPRVVEHYRAAHAIAVRQKEGQGTTEDLRQAMVHYRALFEELLESQVSEPVGGRK